MPGPAVPPLLLWARALGTLVALRARRAALRAGLAAFGLLLLLWASVFLYAAFYYSLMPASALQRPVHYAFRTDCGARGAELCSFPTANVSLLGGHREHVLRGGQRYRVALELELPESPQNRALGMFLVSIRCYGEGGRPLGSAQRAAMLRYRSGLVRAVRALLLAPLLVPGLAEQKQTLELELFGGYREPQLSPTLGAELQIQSRRIQLYSARLSITAQFSGLRLLLQTFPVSAALLGVLGNFSLLSLLLLAGYLRWACAPPAAAGTATTTREEEAPPPPPEEPEVVGTTEGGEEEDAPPPPPPPPKEEEEEEEMAEEEVGGGVVSTPPPLPPQPRHRPTCSSS